MAINEKRVMGSIIKLSLFAKVKVRLDILKIQHTKTIMRF